MSFHAFLEGFCRAQWYTGILHGSDCQKQMIFYSNSDEGRIASAKIPGSVLALVERLRVK